MQFVNNDKSKMALKNDFFNYFPLIISYIYKEFINKHYKKSK